MKRHTWLLCLTEISLCTWLPFRSSPVLCKNQERSLQHYLVEHAHRTPMIGNPATFLIMGALWLSCIKTWFESPSQFFMEKVGQPKSTQRHGGGVQRVSTPTPLASICLLASLILFVYSQILLQDSNRPFMANTSQDQEEGTNQSESGH